MDRCLIVFELDTKCLEKNYHNNSWQNAYSDIRRVLNKYRFNNIQGTVYLSEVGIRQAIFCRPWGNKSYLNLFKKKGLRNPRLGTQSVGGFVLCEVISYLARPTI
jgi:virulence-associated protein VapD